MAFTPGNSGNPTGRPKGSKNVVQNSARESLRSFISDRLDELPEIYNKLDPEKKIDALIKLSAFVIPKLSSVTVESEITIDRFMAMDCTEQADYLETLKSQITQNESH